jgi:hypothetical protein
LDLEEMSSELTQEEITKLGATVAAPQTILIPYTSSKRLDRDEASRMRSTQLSPMGENNMGVRRPSSLRIFSESRLVADKDTVVLNTD